MAKSYTEGRNLYGTWTKNKASDNLELGDEVANDLYREICAMRDWPFLERLRTLTTAASTQKYPLPYDTDFVREVAVIISDTRYTPKLCPDQKFWDELNLSQYTSDIPEWYYVFNNELWLWPICSTAGNTINITQKTKVIDLSIADYTTGTITTATKGSNAIVGGSTAWTDQMVGRYIKITLLNTANTGDGLWYEISGVTAGGALTITKAYGGTSIAAGTAAYTIAQMPLLHESLHYLPWIGAAAQYWAKEKDSRGEYFQGKYESGLNRLTNPNASPTEDMVIYDGLGDSDIINPNLVINL